MLYQISSAPGFGKRLNQRQSGNHPQKSAISQQQNTIITRWYRKPAAVTSLKPFWSRKIKNRQAFNCLPTLIHYKCQDVFARLGYFCLQLIPSRLSNIIRTINQSPKYTQIMFRIRPYYTIPVQIYMACTPHLVATFTFTNFSSS